MDKKIERENWKDERRGYPKKKEEEMEEYWEKEAEKQERYSQVRPSFNFLFFC